MVQHLIHIGSKTILPTGQTIQGESLPVTIASDQHEFPVQVADLPLPHTDSFSRLRVSNPQTLFDSKQVFDQQTLLWNISLTGTASQSFNQNRASTSLTVATTGDIGIRQTKKYWNYQPAKSQLINLTFVMGEPVEGVICRVGYFDGYDGVFLQRDGYEISLVLRSFVCGSVVEEKVLQADWNLNPADGSTPANELVDVDDEFILDLTKAQLLFIDLQWLGSGLVRVALQGDDGPIYLHSFHNANSRDSIYMRSANLPVRYEIESTGGAGSLETICSAVSSEGGQTNLGIVRSASRGISAISISNAAVLSVIAIRLKAGHTHRTILPLSFNIFPTTKLNIYWLLIRNPTRGTGTAANWTSVGATSSVEYDITSTEQLTGGIIVFEGYVSAGSVVDIRSIPDQVGIGAQDIDGLIPDELCLCAKALSSTETVVGSIQWTEL